MLLRKAAGTCNLALMIKLVVGQSSEGELSTAPEPVCMHAADCRPGGDRAQHGMEPQRGVWHWGCAECGRALQ